MYAARFAPSPRLTFALFIETDDGARFRTLALTEEVGRFGIGNRPGALQLNSGYRWPFGRREGALPFWAHRRAASGAGLFPRVIFRVRSSEGRLGTEEPGTRDDHFCLSFLDNRATPDDLDAISCATTFHGERGRYITSDDLAAGYAEPFEIDGAGTMRALERTSLYPPRRDAPCEPIGLCENHPDVARFASDALAVMPELDAVTLATPRAGSEARVEFVLPADWVEPSTVWFEVNTEADYNASFNQTTHPTPSLPPDTWDYWSGYGFPARGQPSVVFRVALPGDIPTRAYAPDGYTDVHGLDGSLRPFGDGAISDDPVGAPGSGANRLIPAPDGVRFTVERHCDR
jgi:hypothetical protein